VISHAGLRSRAGTSWAYHQSFNSIPSSWAKPRSVAQLNQAQLETAKGTETFSPICPRGCSFFDHGPRHADANSGRGQHLARERCGAIGLKLGHWRTLAEFARVLRTEFEAAWTGAWHAAIEMRERGR